MPIILSLAITLTALVSVPAEAPVPTLHAEPRLPVPVASTLRAREAVPPVLVWDLLAECESNGRWDYNGPSGFDGGLQHHPGTWSAYRPDGFPDYAWQATREQQIAVAERVLAAQGWAAWPACSRKMGLR